MEPVTGERLLSFGGKQGHGLGIVVIHLLSLLAGVCESRGELGDAETLMVNDHLLIPRLLSAHLLLTPPSPFNPQPLPTYCKVSLISCFQGRVVGGALQKMAQPQPRGHAFICCIKSIISGSTGGSPETKVRFLRFQRRHYEQKHTNESNLFLVLDCFS